MTYEGLHALLSSLSSAGSAFFFPLFLLVMLGWLCELSELVIVQPPQTNSGECNNNKLIFGLFLNIQHFSTYIFAHTSGLDHLQFTFESHINFAGKIKERDSRRVQTGQHPALCDPMHLIPHSKGSRASFSNSCFSHFNLVNALSQYIKGFLKIVQGKEKPILKKSLVVCEARSSPSARKSDDRCNACLCF
jgi:hypothetical protein